MDAEKLNEMFNRFLEEPPEIFAGALQDMSKVDRAFFNGYVVGYTEGVMHTQAAIKEDESE